MMSSNEWTECAFNVKITLPSLNALDMQNRAKELTARNINNTCSCWCQARCAAIVEFSTKRRYCSNCWVTGFHLIWSQLPCKPHLSSSAEYTAHRTPCLTVVWEVLYQGISHIGLVSSAIRTVALLKHPSSKRDIGVATVGSLDCTAKRIYGRYTDASLQRSATQAAKASTLCLC